MITFEDFKNAGFKDLYIFATSLNTQRLKEFSATNTPTTIVVEAVRASMSIPLFFESFRFSNNIPDDNIYIDGGVVYNYPMDIFDIGDSINPETVGFFITDFKADQTTSQFKYNNIFNYIKNLVNSILNSQYVNFINDDEDVERTVMIDSLGISPTNFKLSDDMKKSLYNSGKNATIDYLSKHHK